MSKGIGAAAGTAVLPIRLRLRPGARPCRVQGVPPVRAHTPTRTLPGTLSTWSQVYRAPVLVTRRSPALVFVTWPDLCLQHGESHVVLTWRGASWRFAAGSAGAACPDLADGRLPRSIGVSRLQPEHVQPPRRVSPYDAIRVRSLTDLSPGPGHTLDFVVTLVARRDTSLDPCPDYELLGSTAPRRLALDCAGVPFRDPRGDPYLPAGRPVRFAMRTAWSPSFAKLCWGLVEPGTPPDDCVTGPQLTGRAGAPARP